MCNVGGGGGGGGDGVPEGGEQGTERRETHFPLLLRPRITRTLIPTPPSSNKPHHSILTVLTTSGSTLVSF